MRGLLTLSIVAFAGAFLLTAARPFTSAPESVGTPISPLEATTYKVDLTHSNILFKCKHLGVSYQYGRFDKFSGTFTLGDDAATSNVSITVDPASVNSNSEGRDKHLRSADYFNVKQFPEMKFESTKITPGDGDAYAVVGSLTLHGVTKEITMDVTKVGEVDAGKMGQRAGFEGSFTIDRMDYGIESAPDMLGHDVRMMFSIEGIK
ncbi:MAG: polyisoprenoid-binding protein YceI [Planctomycetota bacterium]|jgi:polyisoprenoid-binding protein YceI